MERRACLPRIAFLRRLCNKRPDGTRRLVVRIYILRPSSLMMATPVLAVLCGSL